ncbi:Ubiquitin-protein ligase [Cyanidiococcus yangmingshanensis]|uniref:Ubiquitin-protein ligase n=1 Tax=Cyanidiococcus yangmingshanensis TaxID=2690220 RepID=A0A7J7IIU5_9RHOD|nr:Ubiquitin-protein ligase [Cyanidiococcus yangmingshanensis]
MSTCSNAREVLERIANNGQAIEKLVAILAVSESSLDRRHRGLVLRTLSGFASVVQGLRTRMLEAPSEGGLGVCPILANLLGAAPDRGEPGLAGVASSPTDTRNPTSSFPANVEAVVGSALMLVDALSPDFSLVQRLQSVLDLYVRAPTQDQGSKEWRRHAISAMKKTLFALESEDEIRSLSMQLIPTLGYVLLEPIDDEERSTVMGMIEHILERAPNDERVGELFVKEGVVHELESKAAEYALAQRILDRFGDQLRSSGRQRILKLCEIVERLRQGDHSALTVLIPEVKQSSVFEIQTSQLVQVLNEYLCVEQGGAAELADRYSHLLIAVIPALAAFEHLVRSLIAILASTERFEVILNPATNGNVSAGIRLLAQPFRLQIQRWFWQEQYAVA